MIYIICGGASFEAKSESCATPPRPASGEQHTLYGNGLGYALSTLALVCGTRLGHSGAPPPGGSDASARPDEHVGRALRVVGGDG